MSSQTPFLLLPKNQRRRRRGRGRAARAPRGKPSLTDVAAKAYAAYQLAQFVRGLVNAEVKTKDVTGSSTPGTSGSLIQLATIAQGDTAITRDGNSCRLKGIQIRGFATIGSSATDTYLRVLVVLHKFTNGNTPSVTDVLSTASNLSPYASLKHAGYDVLDDQTLILSSVDRTNAAYAFHSRLDVHQDYNSATGDAWSAINNGAMSLLLISSESTNYPAFTYSSRVSFIDN
jgi:hypothetical protein